MTVIIETRRSEEFKDLAAALAKAQGSIEAARKSRDNPHFKSKYADLAEIVSACKGALSENGVARIQTPCFTPEDIWLETMLVHTSGQWIMGRYPIGAPRNNSQALGAAFTYARRFSLAMMVGVVSEDEDDDGEANADHTSEQTGDRRPAPPDDADQDAAVRAKQWTATAVRAIQNISDPKELTGWEERNEKAIRRLYKADQPSHELLMKTLQDHHEKITAKD